MGAAATGTGCVSVSGGGTPASPFVLGLLSSCLPLTVCTSTTRPGSPAVGQPIFETDTNMTRVWTGVAWRPISSGGQILSYKKQADSTQTLNLAGANTIVSLPIPDPGWPYILMAGGDLSLNGGVPNDSWNVSLTDASVSLVVSAECRIMQCGASLINRGQVALPFDVAPLSGSVTLTLAATNGCVTGGGPDTVIHNGRTRISALLIPQ